MAVTVRSAIFLDMLSFIFVEVFGYFKGQAEERGK
jgi:hypothetical protein